MGDVQVKQAELSFTLIYFEIWVFKPFDDYFEFYLLVNNLGIDLRVEWQDKDVISKVCYCSKIKKELKQILHKGWNPELSLE